MNISTVAIEFYKPRRNILYPESSEAIVKPVIDQSASLIDRMIPIEVLISIFREISYPNRVPTSLVSKFWRYISFELMKEQELRQFQLFGNFLGKSISEQYQAEGIKLIELAKGVGFPVPRNFLELGDLLLIFRSQVLNILCQLNEDDLNRLDSDAILKKKPLFFESLFCLAHLNKGMDLYEKEYSSDEIAEFFEKLCKLKAFDIAVELTKKEPFPSIDLALRVIAVALSQLGMWEEALEKACAITDDYNMFEVLIEFFSSGRFNGGIILTSKLKSQAEKERILTIIPTLELIAKGQLNEAMKLNPYDRSFHSSILDKAQVRFCNQLIKEGKLDETIQKASLIYCQDAHQDAITAIFMQLVKLERFAEAEKLSKSVSILEILRCVSKLSSKGKFYEARGIGNSIGYAIGDLPIVSIHEAVLAKKFGTAIKLVCDLPVRRVGNVKDIAFYSIAKKMMAAGLFNEVKNVVSKMEDPVIKSKTIKMINNWL